MKYCAFKRESEPNCPIFLIGDIVKAAEPDENEQRILLNKVNSINCQLFRNALERIPFLRREALYKLKSNGIVTMI